MTHLATEEMKLALLVAALKVLSVEAVLAVHNVQKEAPPNPDEVPLPPVPNVARKEKHM